MVSSTVFDSLLFICSGRPRCAVAGDEALVGRCLDAEAALARARAGLGTYLVPSLR